MTSPATAARFRSLPATVLTVLLALAFVISGTIIGASPARAVTYPSWDDVRAAVANENTKAAQIDELQSLLAQLQSDAANAQSEAEAKGAAFEEAQSAADEAASKLAELQKQVDEQNKVADESEQRAGQVAAQLARTGGGDVSTQLAGDSAGAGDLLYRLGAMSKITEQADGIRQQAVTDRNVASSLGDQAAVAEEALAGLRDDAEDSMQEAQAASDAALAAVTAQQENEATLQAQLAVLQDTTAKTQQDYEAGVEAERQRLAAEKKAREEEAARQAAELQRQQEQAAAAAAEAARVAAAAAAARPSTPSAPRPAAPAPTPARPSTPAPSAGGGGAWVRPSGGYMSSPYGYRINPVTGIYRLHDGVDLAPGCSTPIYAASSGTVSYAGYYGGYGNYVRISHGGGVSTAYGHIVNGGIRVANGQSVVAGQLIALVGSTGNSTGCHLHFETRINGGSTDPVPFMSARGVSLR
ncbi:MULTISPECIES: M23 family metallopeptidase [unclassified Frigoribacterium]|uniref:M23 family metallopeptidase n=1 Tax=unclassified Frigoribacterium TaxID=2627005 RepID=UPI0006FF134B|nr:MULTISPECIES: M23 family metallopeptidase [unclassified Frigoribacterium]KQO80146.1 hypothetical protein ASF17_14330 [Frigoribacterium sp. Leaf263]KQR62017.1 hypothetical protein ASF89_14860 [Frigoribacterium sp. Leaf172]